MSDNKVTLGLQRDGFDLNVSFDLPDRGVVALLGPSGSGKSTVLRSVAGLESAVEGCIRVAGHDWLNSRLKINRAPQQRRVGMVFQDYALFEHMTVADNIGFSVSRGNRKRVVSGLIQTFHLEGLAGRYPKQLSGGQRQRVALARALAHDPDMLLLDEPLSAIDVHLRDRLRNELQAFFLGLNKPTLLVSHDLAEARQLADYVGILVNGRLHRFGVTREVFERPDTVEAARVLGWRNLLPVKSVSGQTAAGDWGQIRLRHAASLHTAMLGIRPEKVCLLPAGEGDLAAEVVRIVDKGAIHEMQCRLSDNTPFYIQRLWSDALAEPGTRIGLGLPMQHLVTLVEGDPGLSPLKHSVERYRIEGDSTCQSHAVASSRPA